MVLHEGGDYREMISGPEDSVAAPAPASKPGWVHSHPYIASSIAVGTFVVFGSILVLQRADVSPSSASADNDTAALLAQLTQNTPVASTSFEASAPDSYSFIPQGLISTEVPVKKRSALQQSLFSYGNQMG